MFNGASKKRMPQLFATDINKLFKNKIHIKSWWRQFKVNKSDKSSNSSSSQTTLDWRSLSPDRPPLPFFLSENSPISSNTSLHKLIDAANRQPLPHTHNNNNTTASNSNDNTNHKHSTLSNTTLDIPIDYSNKKKNLKPIHRANTEDRSYQPLCPILEESETVMSESTESNKVSPQIGENDVEDRIANSSPSPSSSINGIDPTIAIERPLAQQETSIISSENTSSISPSLQQQQTWNEIKSVQKTPSDKYMPHDIVGNEELCKRKFAKMVLAANKFQTGQSDKPTEMTLLFDVHGNIDMMRMVRHGKTELHKFVGNSQYVPPELFNSTKYSSELGDIWVLGVFLYRMLVGKYPFTAANDQQLFKKMLHCDFSIPAELSEDAKDILRRMLAPDSIRASLDLIIYHPWIKPYRHLLLDHYTRPGSTMGTNHTRAPFVQQQQQQQQQQQRRSISYKPSRRSNPSTSTSTTMHEHQPKKAKHHNTKFFRNAIKLIFQGPFPPPKKPYQDLSHLGTRESVFARYKK